jgi:hypothetical protein
MADTLKQWASTQVHRPTDKITATQKLTADFIINKYETWGDLYKAVGIEPPSIPKKDQIKPTPLKAKNVLSELNLAKRSIQLLQDEINRQETGSPAYKKLTGEYNALQIKISNLTNQYEDLNAIEKNVDKVDAAKKKTGSLKTQIASLEEAKKRSADLGQDTKSIDAQIKKLKGDLTETRKVVTTTDTTPNFVAPKVDAEGKPVVTKKPTGGAAEAAASGANKATINDSDGDGIPNATDPEPNTPATKSTKTVKTPIKTPVKTVVKPSVTPVETAPTAAEREATALGAASASDFALPQTLFDNIPSLKALLEKFVKTPGMTMDAFRKELRNDLWFKQNSDEIKARYVQYYNFRDLQASGRAQGTTDYEMQIAKIEANLKKRAVEIGSAAANDPTALRKAAENLYITNRSEDTNFVDGFLAASIKTVAGKIGGQVTEGYSGEALSNYKILVQAARDNGFQLSDIIPGGATEQQVLQGIATGSIDINRVIADARKLAAQGQPQYVRDLLAQGYTLKQVLAPYRQTMANVLEIQDPEEINLNDPLLRSAITDKGDMNMYEFKKALRRDNRWQYTEQARADVSTAALGVLRDFGFQG